MKSFEDSWKENRHVFESTRNLAKVMYLDGQQSKQAEVDELRKNFNNALKTIEIQQRFLDDADGANKILTSQASELQKRIDDLSNYISSDDFIDIRVDYHSQVKDLIKILKGDQS